MNYRHISEWLDSTRDLVGQIYVDVPDSMYNYDISSVFFLVIVSSSLVVLFFP